MNQITLSDALQESTQLRADELFHQHQQALYKRTDKLFAALMLAQWIAGIFAAFTITPLTWEGETSQIHLHIWAAIVLGGLITLFPVALAIFYGGTAFTRYVIAVSQMLMSGLLIHLTGGRIETHFHIFGSLAFLAFYRDWRVLVPATLVTCLDHFIRGVYWPQSIYGVLTASPWRTLEHVGWVAFEDIFLVVASIRSAREMRAIARHTAQLETTNQIIEEKVVQRTAEVKSSEERFRLLMDGVQDYAIFMLDNDGRVASWNEGARRVLGFGTKEIQGSHLSLFYAREDVLDSLPSRELAAAQSEGRFENEGWRVRKDGSRFWANVVLTALYDEAHQLRGFSNVTRDVTERKRAEDALQMAHDDLEIRVEDRTAALQLANEELQVAKLAADAASHAKSEYLSRMSHELRTPLNAILGFGQLLDIQELDPLDQEAVDHILRSGHHLLALINEVLDIARVEAGRMEFSLEPIHVDKVTSEAVALVQPLASKSAIRVKMAPPVGEFIYALADHQRLKQILINLLSNAVKYNRPNGEVEVTIEKMENKVRIAVRDTGIGIAPKNFSKLFTPFERLDAIKTTIEGTGLGLAFSQRMVEAMNGRLEVESVLGVGSTFTVELPASQSPVEQAAPQVEELGEPGPEIGQISTVLLIEDNLSNFQLVERILKYRPNVRLLGAIQGSHGLEMAIHNQPDVILLDLHLPDIMGAEVFRLLREAPETANIPVIIVSADATPSQVQRLMAAGVNAYLTKPLNVKEFLSALDQSLEAVGSV